MLARYYRDLLNFCFRKTRDRAAAEDIVQESYTRMLSMQRSGQVITNPPALLRQIATRVAIDLARRAAVRPTDELDALAVQPAVPRHQQPEEVCAAAQVAEAYIKTIEALPSRCREAFSLHVFDGLSNAEIAQHMGVSASMVKQYIQRGRLACAQCRRDLSGEDEKITP